MRLLQAVARSVLPRRSSPVSSAKHHGLPPVGGHSPTTRRYSRPSGGRKWAFAVFASLLVAFALLVTPPFNRIIRQTMAGWARPVQTVTEAELDALNVNHQTPDNGGERQLRVFMPADSPHVNLCKAIMSAIALGYPPPTLLNWEGEFNRPGWHLAGSHIAKLESLLAVIEELLGATDGHAKAHEHDLAVLVDAYDVWFQLPPSVLIQRYDQLNREADQRTRRQWEATSGLATDVPVSPPRQSIIVTSAKDCSPMSDSGSDPHYQYWPESPMPSDMYGPDTDRVKTFSLDPARKYKNVRPRCVNSGMIMGTMGALRKALQRSKEKVDHVARNGRQLWSDQALLGEVIGEQEMWRSWMKSLGESWNGTHSELDAPRLGSDMRRIADEAMTGKNFEFGIGLDYNFTTIPPTCSAEEDGNFVNLDDQDAVSAETRRAGVPQGQVRVDGVPPELSRKLDGDDPLFDVNWGEVPLYTDFFFGATPVGIHHNAYVGDLKPWRLEHWWSRMWFYPRLRELLAFQLWPTTVRPLGRLPPAEKGAQERVYVAPDFHGRRRAVTVFQPNVSSSSVTLTPMLWDDVCQGGQGRWYEELFGDMQGPLLV